MSRSYSEIDFNQSDILHLTSPDTIAIFLIFLYTNQGKNYGHRKVILLGSVA